MNISEDSEEIDSRVRLKGHKGNVSVLLYPHASQPSSYLPNILYSGGNIFLGIFTRYMRQILIHVRT